MSIFGLQDEDEAVDDGSMFGPKPGTWALLSKKDKRFNMQGRGKVGGLVMPAEAKRALETKKAELGCDAPDDLEFSYFKD